MKTHLTLLAFLFLISFPYTHAERFLVIPSWGSIPSLRSSARVGQLLSNPGSDVLVLLHHSDTDAWNSPSLLTASYGNTDELAAAINKGLPRVKLDSLVISQIKKEKFLKELQKDHFGTVICDVEDAVCRFIISKIKPQRRAFLIKNCPVHWREVFGSSLPGARGFFENVTYYLKTLLKGLVFSKTNDTLPLEYSKKALYLTECFRPLNNPEPVLPNIFPIGSLLGDINAKSELPDTYKKPVLLANKIVVVDLGTEKSTVNNELFIDVMKSFPNYLFVFVSKNFDVGTYSLGNVIVDANAPLNEIFSHSKTAMLISTGEWTILLNALYHNVPVLALGATKAGLFGRALVNGRKLGVDMSKVSYVSSEALQEGIREMVFGGHYKNNVAELSRYLKGMNNHYLLSQIVFNFFSAKANDHDDKDL